MMEEIQFASPVFIIGILSVLIIVVDALGKRNHDLTFLIAVFGLFATGVAAGSSLVLPEEIVARAAEGELAITKGALAFGGYSAFFDLIFCLAGIMTAFSARSYLVREYAEYKEFYSLIIFAVCGMILIAHAANMLILFIGIEIMSVTFYILAGFVRTQKKSVEASLKYFLLGAFATGFLVYGMALIYGATGSLDFSEIYAKASAGEIVPTYLTIGLGLLIVGLAFKASAFPFHQWAPDVYDGSPTIVSAFMSSAGKAAALLAFVIVAKALMPTPEIASELFGIKSAALEALESVNRNTATVQNVAAFIAALTMVLGNLTALAQKNVKRMLAYSSVAHAGYLLMGIVANSPRGFAGILFYAAAYTLMQIGAFIVVAVFERNREYTEIEDYAGMSKRYPVMAAIMSIFMLSLAGIPPMAGFFGKYYLFAAAIESGFTWLAIVAVVSSIISMYFYIGLILQMYFKESKDDPEFAPDLGGSRVTLIIATFGVLLFGIFPNLIIDLGVKFF